MKRKNVCIFLRDREYSEKNNKRRDFRILSTLICFVSAVMSRDLKISQSSAKYHQLALAGCTV